MKKEKSSRPGHGKILDAWIPPDNGGEPIGCVATSFTFSPALFEEECLGRFVALETNAVEDGPAYLVEREEKLSQLRCAAALVDQHHARGIRSLRWDLLAARLPRGILHAKVSLLLWSNHARLIVGSANLTEDGYRRNQEVFAAVNFFAGSEAPLEVLDEICGFLREAVKFATPANAPPGPAVLRWLGFLDIVRKMTRDWGSNTTPRGFAKPRVIAILSGPDRPNVLAALRDRWPDASPPDQAYVVSPFFDPPEASNEPARQIWNALKQRESAVEYHVTVEEVPGKKALLIHAPRSLNTGGAPSFHRLQRDQSRPLHAKCIWLQNKQKILYLVGSSNFTSAGLGLGAVQNLEANLAFIVGEQSSDGKKAFTDAWLPSEPIPNDVELLWQPRDNDSEDGPSGELLALPSAFADASLGGDACNRYITLKFAGTPPAGWELFADEEDVPSFTENGWRSQHCPAEVQLPWNDCHAPAGFRVRWAQSARFAWWPVNVVNSAALPPPEELKDLPLEVLINILTSAKPLHLALAWWLKHKKSNGPSLIDSSMDPHKRVDTSAFLLQRTRRISWALTALRQRLERPVFSAESLGWRLRGPVGAWAVAQAITKEARSEPERCFLLTELCLDLSRVRPQVESGSLSKKRVLEAVNGLIREIYAGMSLADLDANPAMAKYAKGAFEGLLK